MPDLTRFSIFFSILILGCRFFSFSFWQRLSRHVDNRTLIRLTLLFAWRTDVPIGPYKDPPNLSEYLPCTWASIFYAHFWTTFFADLSKCFGVDTKVMGDKHFANPKLYVHAIRSAGPMPIPRERCLELPIVTPECTRRDLNRRRFEIDDTIQT